MRLRAEPCLTRWIIACIRLRPKHETVQHSPGRSDESQPWRKRKDLKKRKAKDAGNQTRPLRLSGWGIILISAWAGRVERKLRLECQHGRTTVGSVTGLCEISYEHAVPSGFLQFGFAVLFYYGYGRDV